MEDKKFFKNRYLLIVIGVLILIGAILVLKNLQIRQYFPTIDVNIKWSSQPKNETEDIQSKSDSNNLQLNHRENIPPQKTETNTSSAKQKIEELLLEEGLKFYEQKRYDDAKKAFDEVIKMNPNNDIAYTYRGKCWYIKKYGISDFDRAIEINPSNADAYNARGIAYMELENYEQGISDFNKAIELDTNFYKAYHNRAIYYLKLNQYDAAIANCNKSIQINPNYADAYNLRGHIYNKLKKYDMALTDLNKSIELDPTSGNPYSNRGDTYWALKEYDKANDDYAKARERGKIIFR